MFKVYLAMEAGYMEKVDELCERYSLDKFLDIKGKAFFCDLPSLHALMLLPFWFVYLIVM
jgi:hypothetical protein